MIGLALIDRALHTKEGPLSFTLYDEVSDPGTLAAAWSHVRRSGMLSQSEKTKASIKAFESDADAQLAKIASQLTEHSFDFGTARAAPIRREGKEPRPLLVPEIPARIVQRALLDTLQKQEGISEFVDHPCSYGGLPDKNRADAIRHACEAIADRATYVIRSDIPRFFTRILRHDVLQTIQAILSDDSLADFLDEATSIEIGNAERIQSYLHLFPDYNEGVAQGCCLSPLFGNVYLHDFDIAMNAGDIVTLRYIDDFVILGRDRKSTEEAFRQARQMLQSLNLDAYRPSDRSGKAAEGSVKRGFEFLGCKITPHCVEPSRAARHAFLERVRKQLDLAAHEIRAGSHDSPEDYRYSLVQTLSRISRMIRGWSEQYRFCNRSDAFTSIDVKVDRMVERFLRSFFRLYRKSRRSPAVRRRLLGIWLAADSSRTPILPMRSR